MSITDPSNCPICDYPPPEDRCLLCSGERRAPRPRRFFLWDMLRGFIIYFQGALRVLNHKPYLGKLLWPIVLNVVVSVALIATSYLWVYRGIDAAVQGIADWAGSTYQSMPAWIQTICTWIRPLFIWFWSAVVAFLLTYCFAVFLFPVVMSLFLFPVLDPLSRLAEAEALGWQPPASVRGFWGDFWDSLDTGARILIRQILLLLIFLPLSMFVFGLPVALLVGGFLAGFAWIDYPFSRRGYRYEQKWSLAKRNWPLLTGFGVAFMLGLLIPIFGFMLAGPAAAVGSAFLYFEFSGRQ
ncbi:MAG: EI24 domain-containing protein [Planctomycetota bacterium]